MMTNCSAMIIGDALVGRPRKLTPAFYWVMAHRFLTLKGGKKMYSYAEYERKKADWVQANPEATPQEYQAAMRRIALECGV
jgi:hypothetical protein